jgi:rubrerythrin
MTPVKPEILNALSVGIQSEVAAYVFYIEAAKKSQANEFKDVLQKLALEEKTHFQILEGEHSSLVRSEQWVSTADILKRPGLPEIGEDMSIHHKELINEVRTADSVKKILEIAYRLEEEAYELFDREAKRTTSPEGKKIFSELAEFEQGHMTIINAMMKKYGIR